jgi:hypothetical protein
LPPLIPRELLEVSLIHSIAGDLAGGALTDRRPFRAPHHSASMAALVGGGTRARPGEISLAHHGVLFLDELPECQPQVLDSLRQPLETGEVAIARANHRIVYPARFQLVAAMNPCRCGHASEPGFTCNRQPNARCIVPNIRRGFRVPCSTASTSMSKCPRSPPPISCCRRPPRGHERSRNALPPPEIFRSRVLLRSPTPPTPEPIPLPLIPGV